MKIPENRIYKVRSTARQAPKIADPNLGAYPAAIARGMAPAIQGAIAATGQQIRNTLQAAKNPHWLTHLKLAQTIAQTGAQTSRDLATAYERRLAHGLEDDLANLAKSRTEFFANAGADDLATLDAFNAAYNESDYYQGLSGERRARLDAVRDRERVKYEERELGKAIDRRRRVRAMEADGKFMAYIDGQFRDHPDENGNVVSGLVNTKWTRGDNGEDSDGPVKRLVELDKSFDETDYAKSMTAEERDAFEERRPRLLSQYMREAEAAQQRQMKAEREKAVRDYGMELANNVDAAIMAPPGEEAMVNFGAAVDELARFAADQIVPGEEETVFDENGNEVHSPSWNKAYRDATQAQWARRFGVITGAFEVAPDLTADDKQKAAELEGAIRGTLAAIDAGGGMYTEEERLAAHASWDASRMKRAANIEAGYQRAEKDAGIANADWLLSKAGSDGDTERNGADARMNEALARLPDGRREAAMAKIVAEREEKAAFDFVEDHANDFFSKAGMDALKNSGLSDNAKRIAGKIALKSEDARDKARSDAKNRVNRWIASDGKTAGEIVNLLRGIAESTGDVDTFEYGIKALADEADYLRMFEKQPELRTEYEGIILEGMKEAYGEDIVSLLKFDKNGHIVWGADNRPALADGVTPETMARGLKRGTRQSYMTVPGGQRVTLNNDIFTEISAQTVADTLSLGRKYVMLRHMGNGPDGTTGKPVASEWAKYLKDMMGPDIAKLDDAAIGVTTRRFLEAMPGWVWSDSTAKQESRELLREVRKSNRPAPEEGGNNELE